MDEEILKSLENISDNLEYLIDYLQTSQETKQNNNSNKVSLDLVSDNFSAFDNYLKSIDNNIKISNQKMSAYMDSINTLEDNRGIGDNPELEQFNQSIINLISKLDDLKNSLSSLTLGLNVNVDTSQIDAIKEKLNSDFIVNLDVANIDVAIDEINQKLESLNNISVNLDFGNSLNNLNNLVTELNNIKDIKFDNLNLDIVNPENIQKILDDLKQIENISNVNLNELKTSLEEIQKIDLSELSNPIKMSIDTSDISKEINIINTEFLKLENLQIDLNFNTNLSEKIDEIKTELAKTSSDLKANISIESEISYKLNPESLQTIKSDFENIEFSINPDNELLTKIKQDLESTEFDIKVNPIIDTNPIIETKNDTEFKIIKEDNENPANDKLLLSMQENNKLLSTLVDVLNTKDQKKEVINVIPETVTKQESVVNVNPETTLDVSKTSNSEMSVLIGLMKDLVNTNKTMLKKMTQSKFITDIEI